MRYRASRRWARATAFGRSAKSLGVTAFGINAVVLPPDYETGVHYHDEQEETYFVHKGQVEFRFGDGSKHMLGTGRPGPRRRPHPSRDAQRGQGRRRRGDRRGQGRLRRARRPGRRQDLGGRSARRPLSSLRGTLEARSGPLAARPAGRGARLGSSGCGDRRARADDRAGPAGMGRPHERVGPGRQRRLCADGARPRRCGARDRRRPQLRRGGRGLAGGDAPGARERAGARRALGERRLAVQARPLAGRADRRRTCSGPRRWSGRALAFGLAPTRREIAARLGLDEDYLRGRWAGAARCRGHGARSRSSSARWSTGCRCSSAARRRITAPTTIMIGQRGLGRAPGLGAAAGRADRRSVAGGGAAGRAPVAAAARRRACRADRRHRDAAERGRRGP